MQTIEVRAGHKPGGLQQGLRLLVVQIRGPKLLRLDEVTSLRPVPDAIVTGGGERLGIEAGHQPWAVLAAC